MKICDFGYSKSSLLHSQPKSTVGTPAYIAPEVLNHQEYDGRTVDMWSCGVTLYVMLCGCYPFEDPVEPRNFRKTIERIMTVTYGFPQDVQISAECRDLIARIFVLDPAARITLPEVKQHPWFMVNLPADLDGNMDAEPSNMQSLDEIRRIVQEAKFLHGQAPDDTMNDVGDDDVYTSGDYFDVTTN